MTYDETVDFLFSQLPMFQRDGKAAYKADLSRTIDLCNRIGNPQNQLKCIHIAGTNGKGSTANIISAILQKSGYKTGLFTSPHYLDYRERIKVNGVPIEKDFVVSFVDQYSTDVSDIKPSFFEWTAALAFSYFHKKKVDFVVLETGMGGRLDSTNVVQPVISVITQIALDHQEFLGNDLQSIAREKAGIIKPGIPVIIGNNEAVVLARIEEVANKNHSKVVHTKADESPGYKTDLVGDFQQYNIAVALATIRELQAEGIITTTDSIIETALNEVSKLTGMIGRMMRIESNPDVILDSAHNEAGIKALLKEVNTGNYQSIHVVFGTTHVDDLIHFISLFPTNCIFYFAGSDLPRMMTIDAIQSTLAPNNSICETHGYFSNAWVALSESKEMANKEDLILVTGSIFIVADILKQISPPVLEDN